MPLSLLIRNRIERNALEILRLQPAIDPVLGVEFSTIHTRLGAVAKRDGIILGEVIVEALRQSPFLNVWCRPRLQIPAQADLLATNFDDCQHAELPYRANAGRTVCPDLVVLDHRCGRIAAYEIKRGNGTLDSGKRRSVVRDLLATRMILSAWGQQQGFRPATVDGRAVFVYGNERFHKIDPRLALYRGEVDEHFGIEVTRDLEDARALFRHCLLARRDELLGQAA